MRLLFIYILFSLPLIGFSQPPNKLKLFLDCETCDQSFIKSEIQIIDFVTDRIASDIHLLVTATNNANGGTNYQLVYYGQNRFKGRTEKVLFTVPANATSVESRAEVSKRIKLGLVPFIIHTPWSAYINIDMKLPDTTKKQKLPEIHTTDKWNYWVFKAGLDGTFSADQVYQTGQLSTTLTANRTTEDVKDHFMLQTNYSRYVYKYEDNGNTIKYKFSNSSYDFLHFHVKSIEENWSLGYEVAYSNSTFSNNKSRIQLSGGVEYAIIPYKMVNTKTFTISYNWQMTHNRYYDTTIYDRINDFLPGQRLQANLSLKEKWGSLNGGITYSNYFEDFKFNNLSADMSLNLRVTGGLFFYVYFSGALVHDQLNLPKGNASAQDILSRRRQLASSYNFYSGAGLSYQFGSILNNFVNPRLSSY